MSDIGLPGLTASLALHAAWVSCLALPGVVMLAVAELAHRRLAPLRALWPAAPIAAIPPALLATALHVLLADREDDWLAAGLRADRVAELPFLPAVTLALVAAALWLLRAMRSSPTHGPRGWS